MQKIYNKLSNVFEFLFNNRYKIAIIVFLLCLVCKINGSSVGIWNDYINSGVSSDFGILFGKNRPIRSDEWATLSPMYLSQILDGFHYFNNSIRATQTDVFMIYALPVSGFLSIFRPFLLGFILFGFKIGLSFFWAGRFIALFIVSIDFLMILTNKNKKLSFIGSLMITLSPLVQWWFAVNGIAELFIYGELAIIMLYKYLKDNRFIKRIIYLLVMLICAIGYVLIVYPSWQIPMFYVFLVIAIWLIIDNKKTIKINKKDIISIVFTIIVAGLIMLYILKQSKETISIVSNTIYPGKRFETGGNNISRYFKYALGMFLPYKQSGALPNVCEFALMFGLFPIGIILSCYNLRNKKDLLTYLLFIVYAFISVYLIFGFPKILAKISLLYQSQASRTIIAIGFMDIILLVRSLSLKEKKISNKKAFIVSFILSIIMVLLNYKYAKEYLITPMYICLFIEVIYLFYFALTYNSKIQKTLFMLGIIFVMFVSGLTVNPIRRGDANLTNNLVLNEVKNVDKKDSGIWITEGYGYPVNNFILMAGVKTINSTNTYPDLNKWHKIDKSKKYEKVYNRYAHIQMNIIDNDKKDKFELIGPDYFIVNANNSDIEKLNVKYIFTGNKLDKYSDKKVKYKLIKQVTNYYIYKVVMINEK